MAESFPTTLGAQLAKVRDGEAELQRTTLAAMDAVANDVAARGDGGERGGFGSVEEFVFAIHGLNPHRSEGSEAVAYYGSIAEQFGEASWGQIFSLNTATVAESKQLWLHAIDGSDERAWRMRGIAEPSYSALRYVVERWDNGSNATFLGKIMLQGVFSTQDDHPAKRHDLILKTFARPVGGAAASFDVSGVMKPIPKVQWGLAAIEQLNMRDTAQVAEISFAFSLAQQRIYRHPDFAATPRMLDD